MPLKINYLTPSEKNKFLIGKITFFNTYRIPSVDFPYFYLGQSPEIIYYSLWPDLVSYLYDKKIGYFTTINSIYQFKDNFIVSGFYVNNNVLTLTFLEEQSLKILNALIEDRELYRFENGSYANWNRTLTPNTNIVGNNKIILARNSNYKIENLYKIGSEVRLDINISNIENINLQLLNNVSIEFGLYRMPNKTKTESIYYHGINAKYLCTPSSTDFVGGLKNRSQVISHFHNHKHNMNEHTHKITHSHSLNNHSHGMNHYHPYNDSFANTTNVIYGPVIMRVGYSDLYFGTTVNVLGGSVLDSNKQTDFIYSSTGLPSVLETGLQNRSITEPAFNSVTNNNTSVNQTKTTEKDSVITDDDNFKIGDRNYYNSSIVYMYMYGGKYIPTT